MQCGDSYGVNQNSEETEEKEEKEDKEEKEEKEESKSKSNLIKATKMPEESAVQYVAKLKAKLIADRNIRMATTKPTATKVVKSQQVNNVQPPRKIPPIIAGYIGPKVLHKDVKDVDDVKKAEGVREAEDEDEDGMRLKMKA